MEQPLTPSRQARPRQCLVTYRVGLLEGQKVVAEGEKTHSMRYFFPMEAKLMLE